MVFSRDDPLCARREHIALLPHRRELLWRIHQNIHSAGPSGEEPADFPEALEEGLGGARDHDEVQVTQLSSSPRAQESNT